jgi:hypothetical protein
MFGRISKLLGQASCNQDAETRPDPDTDGHQARNTA